MLVQVTQKHIDEGKAGECCSCPIALAINDLLSDEFESAAGTKLITISGKKAGCVSLKLSAPVSAAKFIVDFDDFNDEQMGGQKPDKPVPFSFELDISPKYLKESSNAGYSEGNEKAH